MHSSRGWIAALAVAVIAVAFVAGCGGGSDNPTDATTGSVTGRILDYSQLVGIGGVTVTIGGHSALSDVNGYFTVTGINPGSNLAVTVTPPVGSGLVIPANDPVPSVNVVAGQTTQFGDPIYLMDESDTPPDPPGS